MDDIVIFRNKCGKFSENEVSHILIDTYIIYIYVTLLMIQKSNWNLWLFWKNKVMALKEEGEFSDFMFLK